MTIKNWAKKNQRLLLALGIVALIMMMSNGLGEQATIPSQESCDSFNDGIFNELDGCINSGCAVNAGDGGLGFIGETFECAIVLVDGIGTDCRASPIIDREFLAKSESQATALCGEGKKSVKVGTFCLTKEVFRCIDIPAEDLCKDNFMGGLGKFVKDLGIPIENCNSAGLLGIGVIILFMVIALSFL